MVHLGQTVQHTTDLQFMTEAHDTPELHVFIKQGEVNKNNLFDYQQISLVVYKINNCEHYSRLMLIDRAASDGICVRVCRM